MTRLRKFFLSVGATSGRVFYAGKSPPRERVTEAFGREYWDDDDKKRSRVLRKILSQSVVEVARHPLLEGDARLEGVESIFLLDDTNRVFAFTLASKNRVGRLLERRSYVSESFTFQVSGTDHLNDSAVEKAIARWARNNFPRVPSLLTIGALKRPKSPRQSGLRLSQLPALRKDRPEPPGGSWSQKKPAELIAPKRAA